MFFAYAVFMLPTYNQHAPSRSAHLAVIWPLVFILVVALATGTTMEKWTEVGKDLGLEGKDLVEFIRERENAAREERAQMLELRRCEKEVLDKQLAIKQMDRDEENESRKSQTITRGKPPKLPPFEDDRDDIDSYLQRFERYANSLSWPTDTWAINLSALLTGKALQVYSRMPTKDAQDYSLVKSALLKRYNFTEEGYRMRFRTAKPQKSESPCEFAVRLENDFDRWVELSNMDQTYCNLKNLLIREQFLNSCGPELSVFLKERTPGDVFSMAKLAEQFIEARGVAFNRFTKSDSSKAQTGTMNNRPSYQQKRLDSPSSSGVKSNHPGATSSQGQPPRNCYVCGRRGHFAKDCNMRLHPTKTASMLETNNPIQDTNPESEMQGETLQAYSEEHESDAVHERNAETGAFMMSPHQFNECCKEDDHVVLRCGNQLPIMSAACGGQKARHMPVKKGIVGEQEVTVLRDSGCSGVVVRRNLVKEDQLSGEQRACVLIDGTVKCFPVGHIQVNTPYFVGHTEAICMEKPVYDLIIGNIEGVRDPADPDPNWIFPPKSLKVEGHAVQTRAQRKEESRPQRGLKVPSAIGEIVSVEDLKAEQQSDVTLHRYREFAESQQVKTGKNGDTSSFTYYKGILYREYSSVRKNKEKTQQVVVPSKYRAQVMKLAHETMFGGHQGVSKTTERVMSSFYWPGIQADIKRYIRSCDICQRTFPRGKVQKVPLNSMPIIDTPFQRVAVDIVGPISPVTSKGNRYILTIVDYATRYPEAVPLRNIETPTVAEALVDVFSRVGVPREILTDMGSQFTSGLMKEVSRLLSVRQLTTTPYHPACNGLVERFNGTLKQMLRRMCVEKPNDWDRYLAALLFAYREAPQASLGFSPFELLYGRTVRGPMLILKELWTGQTPESEVKTTYEYVVDLQNRLEETIKLAHENLDQASSEQRKYYNRKTSDRKFKPGDSVLLLLPTDKNKLLLHWKGPFKVVAKQGPCDYKIDINGKIKTFHANLLKFYIHRKPEDADVEIAGTAAVICDDSEEATPIGTDFLSPPPSLSPQESIHDVTLDEQLSGEQVQEVQELLVKYLEVLTDLPGKTTVVEHDIKLTTSQPIRSRPYRLPYASRKHVQEEVDSMLKMGVIEPSESPYASPIVLVDKKDGSKRFCVDFRALNRTTIFDAEPLPDPEEIFASLSQKKYFSKFDLSKGYWQVPVRKDVRPLTAFLTSDGLYQFRMMPFGLVNAPATFTRLMRRVLHGLSNTNNFIDDILIHTATWEEHLLAIEALLKRLRSAGLTAKPSKCVIGAQTLDFLGHVIGKGVLQPQEDKVQKIQDAKRPETKKELRSFLGLAGYYRRFIPNFAAVAAPLTDLTKASEPNHISWGDSQEQAFNTLKMKMISTPILQLPDCQQPFILRTDASNIGIGAVLLQRNEEIGDDFPVAYASRKLLQREKAYATVEKECLAIVYGIQKFAPYLYGREFTLQTDHLSLLYIQKAKLNNSRVMRWALLLQPYRFRVEAIKGSNNVGADFLSRNNHADM